MTKMSNEQLVSAINYEFDNAVGRSGGEIAQQRAAAYDYFMCKLTGKEVEGESKVISADVAEVIDSYMPSLLRMFTIADNLVTFDAVGPEDEAAAEQETDTVTHVFFKENPSFLILFMWFFDALLQKNGIVKAWWDETNTKTTESYVGLTDEDLAELDEDEELEVVESSSRKDEITVDVETVMGTLPQKTTMTVHDVKYTRTCKYGKVTVAPVPVEEYRISNDCPSVDPCGARFVGQEREITRSDLKAMGIFDNKVIDELPATGEIQISKPEADARKGTSDERDTSKKTVDRSQDKILLREGYYKVDFDGDGYAELRQVFVANSVLLSNEEVDRQIFHVLCPAPLPHKHFGRSIADKVMPIQDVNTAILRQMMNNLYRTNMPGHAVWEQGMGDNTLDDLLTVEVGRTVRFARSPQESYMPMTVPFTAAASFPMLEYFDKQKRDRTGISSDASGLSPDALKNIQMSVLMQAQDMSKLKQEAVARIFAETGIKSLFLHIHELLLKHQDREKVFKLRGEWVRVKPTEWRTRQNMTVGIGLGIGTREQNLVHLNAIFEKQLAMIDNSLNLVVTPQNLYQTCIEIVKNANYKQHEMFFTDPHDELAPPPSSEQEQLQKQQQELIARQQQLDQQEQAIKQAQVMSRHENERTRMMLEHARDMQKLNDARVAEQNRMIKAMEDVANKLTELELKYNQNVPGSKV